MSDAPILVLSIRELEELIQSFLTEYLKQRTKETKGTYERALREFVRFFAAERGAFRFTSDDVERYKTHLSDARQLHQVSVSTYLTSLRRLCQYLVDRGLLPENPARAVGGNKRPGDHSRGVLSLTDIDRLFAAIEPATLLNRRDRVAVRLMLSSGLTEIEIVRADVGDLGRTPSGGWQLPVQGKGREIKDEVVEVSDEVIGELDGYLRLRGGTGALDPAEPLLASHGHRSDGGRLTTRALRQRINGHLRAAGLKRSGISPHSLTHTAALLMLDAGLSLEEVQRRMRHGTPATTQIYLRQVGTLHRPDTALPDLERIASDSIDSLSESA